MMVTDIVGSTAAAARLGDVAWKALLARHYDSVRRELDSFRGIEVRAGVHSGEVERHGEHLRGAAVHIAARIAALAQPSKILLSTSTTAILEGSGLNFSDAGEHELKGLAERRRLFRLDDAASAAQPRTVAALA